MNLGLRTQKVRTIHDIDLEPLKVHNYDGGKLEPAYEPPDGPTPVDIDSSLKTYNGSCHCGKVTFAVQSKPLEDLEMTECNCAICLKVRTPSTRLNRGLII